jgi:hypothetical protein
MIRYFILIDQSCGGTILKADICDIKIRLGIRIFYCTQEHNDHQAEEPFLHGAFY